MLLFQKKFLKNLRFVLPIGLILTGLLAIQFHSLTHITSFKSTRTTSQVQIDQPVANGLIIQEDSSISSADCLNCILVKHLQAKIIQTHLQGICIVETPVESYTVYSIINFHQQFKKLRAPPVNFS